VFIGYFALVIGGIPVFEPEGPRIIPFLIYVTALTGFLVLICWITGEPPRWRWGGQTVDAPRPNPRSQLLVHLFLGPLILAIAIYFRVYPPEHVNSNYGYRTPTSMQSQAAWDEAQRYSANIMLIVAVALITYQIISCFIMRPVLSVATSLALLLLFVFATIPLTESHLKEKFGAPREKMEVLRH
jgi:hypothetical protein